MIANPSQHAQDIAWELAERLRAAGVDCATDPDRAAHVVFPGREDFAVHAFDLPDGRTMINYQGWGHGVLRPPIAEPPFGFDWPEVAGRIVAAMNTSQLAYEAFQAGEAKARDRAAESIALFVRDYPMPTGRPPAIEAYFFREPAGVATRYNVTLHGLTEDQLEDMLQFAANQGKEGNAS